MDDGLFDNLTTDQRCALRRIVGNWIAEGFTTPPYEDVYYDIFEALDLTTSDERPGRGYDTRRPVGPSQP